jgi:glycosyltransferase involved in cell wall biosynthesis
MALPSKLTAYFSSGRPVVAAVADGSETARELRDSNAGIVARPDDPGALLEAIARVAGDRGLSAYLGSQGQAWARDVLSPEAALQSYEHLLASVLAAGQRGRVVIPSPMRTSRVAQATPPAFDDTPALDERQGRQAA